MSKPTNLHLEKVFPNWVWLVYLGLFALSIPWYLPAQLEMQLVLGLPFWLVACIFVIVIMAFFTIWIIHKYWKE